MNGIQNVHYHNSLQMTGTSQYKPSSSIVTEPLSEKYTVGESIGRGKFAVVKKCINKATDEVVAAKFIKKRRRGKSCREEILREVVMLELALDHPRLVNLKEVYETTSELILITEYCAGGELFTECVVEEKFNEGDVRFLMSQILEGLVYLHEKNIVHLDLKPQNILLTTEYPAGSIKICDLGFACLVNTGEDIRDIIGTPDYVAPEVLNYDPLGLYTDMWSVGVLAYVMLTTCSPFAADDKQMTFCNITTVNLEFPDDLFGKISGAAQDFIKQLLIADPSERMTARECLSHTWLSGVSDPDKCIGTSIHVDDDDSSAETFSDALSSNAFDEESKSVIKIQDQHSDMIVGDNKDKKQTVGDVQSSDIYTLERGTSHGDTAKLLIDQEKNDDDGSGKNKRNSGIVLTTRTGEVMAETTVSPDTDSSMCVSDQKSEFDSGVASGTGSRNGQTRSGRSSTDLELTSDRDSDGALFESCSETEMVHRTVSDATQTKETDDSVRRHGDITPEEFDSSGMDDVSIFNCNINHNAHTEGDEMEHSDSVFDDALRMTNSNVHEDLEIESSNVIQVIVGKSSSESEDSEMTSPFTQEPEVNIRPKKVSNFHIVDKPGQGRHSYGESSNRDNQNPYDLASRGRNSVGGIDENIHTMQLGEKHKRGMCDGALSASMDNTEGTDETEYEFISVSKRVKSFEALSPIAKTPPSPYSPKIPRSPRIGRNLKGQFHH